MTTTEPKKFSLVKPTSETPFHIDFAWWKEHDNNWRVFLLSFLCPEHQAMYEKESDEIMIDWVDPQTAEIKPIDGLQHILMSHCAVQPEFRTQNTTIVESVFRIFLANGNSPLTAQQISEELNRPVSVILQTFGGMQVYRGIRPFQN